MADDGGTSSAPLSVFKRGVAVFVDHISGIAVYRTWIDVEFYPAKDVINREKHGFSLALGTRILANPLLTEQDSRHDYGELRFNAFSVVSGRLLVCTYTMRHQTHRISSVRKASRQEQRQCLL